MIGLYIHYNIEHRYRLPQTLWVQALLQPRLFDVVQDVVILKDLSKWSHCEAGLAIIKSPLIVAIISSDH